MLYHLVFSRAIVGLLKPSKRSEPDSEGFLVGRDIYLLCATMSFYVDYDIPNKKNQTMPLKDNS